MRPKQDVIITWLKLIMQLYMATWSRLLHANCVVHWLLYFIVFCRCMWHVMLRDVTSETAQRCTVVNWTEHYFNATRTTCVSVSYSEFIRSFIEITSLSSDSLVMDTNIWKNQFDFANRCGMQKHLFVMECLQVVHLRRKTNKSTKMIFFRQVIATEAKSYDYCVRSVAVKFVLERTLLYQCLMQHFAGRCPCSGIQELSQLIGGFFP